MQLYRSLMIVSCESRRKDTSMKQEREKPVEVLLLTVPQAARALGLGRTKVYELIATGGLPTVRFGRSVRIPVAKLQEWIDQYSEQHIA